MTETRGRLHFRDTVVKQFARRQSPVANVFLVILLVAVTTVLRLAADPLLGNAQPFTIYYAAVAIAAWLGGFWPAVLAIVLSYFTADWFFLQPRYHFDWPKIALDDFLALGGFLFSGLAIAATSEAMHRGVARVKTRQALLVQEMAERRKAEESLREAQLSLQRQNQELESIVAERTAGMRENLKSLESVCYHIAHDLRAPLRAIAAYSGILLEESAPLLSQSSNDYLHRISASVCRMDELISALLEYGRVGVEELKPARIAMGPLCAAVVATMRAGIEARHAQIEFKEPLDDVVATERLLRTVLLQLLDNALKFTADGPPPAITFSTYRRDGRVRVLVHDNGIGIPAAYHSRVFRLFEQLEKSRYSGSGMGLAIVCKAVERMRGTAGVDSEPGKGSTFWVELPAPDPL